MRSAEGGLILKFDEATSTINMYRLCEMKIYVSSYGKKDYESLKRSSSKNGSSDKSVFDFHRFNYKIQKGKELESRVDIRLFKACLSKNYSV